jgi:hypothetical protein
VRALTLTVLFIDSYQFLVPGIPVWVGRKLYTRYKTANKHKRNAAIVGGVMASVSVDGVLLAALQHLICA